MREKCELDQCPEPLRDALSPFVRYGLRWISPPANFNTKQNRRFSVDTSQKMKITRNMQGVTLIELMLVMTIMAILMGIAIPSFNSTIRDNRVLTAANGYAAAIATARAEAVRRGRMVSVCPSADGAACSTDWSAGWIVYVEKDTVVAGGAPDVDLVLATGNAVKATTATRTAGANDWVRFSSRGITEELMTLEIKPAACDAGFSFQELTISLVGRPAFTKKTC